MKRIISVSLAVLCLVILVFQIEVNQQNEAWALSRPNITPPNNFNNILFTKYVPNSGGITQYLVVANSTAVSPTSATINVYNANSTNLIGSINYAGVLGTINAGNNWQFINASCDKSGNSGLCALSFTSTGSANAVVFMINVYTQTISVNATRFTFTNGFTPVVSLFNDGTFTHVYVEYDNGGTLQTHVVKLALNTTQSLSATSNRLVQQADVISNVRMSGLGNSDTAIVNSGAQAGQWIAFMNTASMQLWSISSASRTCGANLVAGSVGDIDYVNDNTGQYFLVTAGSTTLYKIDMGCNILATQGPFANSILSISHNSNRNEAYLAIAGNQIQVINETTLSTTVIATYASVTSPAIHYNNLATDNAYGGSSFQPNNPFLALGGGGHPATIYLFYWGNTGTGSSGGSSNGNTCNASSGNPKDCVGQIDCSLPANVNLALCFINQNPKNNNGFSGTGGMLNASVTTLSCSIGLVKCIFDSNGNGTPINGNVQTNGVGYLIAIIGLAILISIFWVASDHDLRNIPTFVWFIGVLGLLGALVALQWLDPTFFIVAIIAVVGLASAKARGLFDSF